MDSNIRKLIGLAQNKDGGYSPVILNALIIVIYMYYMYYIYVLYTCNNTALLLHTVN